MKSIKEKAVEAIQTVTGTTKTEYNAAIEDAARVAREKGYESAATAILELKVKDAAK